MDNLYVNKKIILDMKHEEGFAIIEVLAVAIILGILTSIALPRFLSVKDDAEDSVCECNLATIDAQLERHYRENGSFPASLAALTGDSNYFPDGMPKCPEGGTYEIQSGRSTCTIYRPAAP